ncbi:hypothetical protein GIW06_11990 [Pseudomonas syringae]|nr:hypothetical protein [Pseudomonas syringae]MCF5205862.1 hypothetical protein [Pseudomonas syringae]MCF5273218.1 hypothetical protein [Pseudomonas syringae]MCF5274725.1 hypothetical protein [Pseudomonas syringae]MCF5282051.1 hypothetical protein [Pseudomonas syringae]
MAGRESPRPAGRPGVGIALQRWRDWISRLRHPSRRTALQEDAERPERHAHAEHGHNSVLKDAYRSSRSGVTPEGWMQPLEASWVNIQSRQNSQP